ncbi:unnamed protein product [Lampetra planeri]
MGACAAGEREGQQRKRAGKCEAFRQPVLSSASVSCASHFALDRPTTVCCVGDRPSSRYEERLVQRVLVSSATRIDCLYAAAV